MSTLSMGILLQTQHESLRGMSKLYSVDGKLNVGGRGRGQLIVCRRHRVTVMLMPPFLSRMETSDYSAPAPQKKGRKLHPGAALGIYPPKNDRFKKGTTRYWNGEVDLDSIIAFISHLKEEDKLPHSLIRLRGLLRNAFPGFQTNKNLIREAYEKAGWDIDELMDITKKQRKEMAEELKQLRLEAKEFGDQ
ncbi:hypothetical protein CVT26_013798 [Gymnopilus dilepis]|uniref:Uncharacterized protein n=1 Tax=Gymnopilus dilepis TaxID=231916 RepID=A0A409VVS0_9AGAR|nr:hypothetical protein CVT26_013798 [Gymnopilus dilepis]